MEALPDWLTPLPDAEQMRAIDRWAIEQQQIPGIELMERAGEGVARALERIAPDGPVAVLAGKGNNGGDGFVAARLLRRGGRDVRVICTSPPDELSGDAAANLERLPGPGPVRLDGASWESGEAGPPPLEGATVLLDALLGTGFSGSPHGPVAEAIAAIAASRLPVVSVDVPSGVDASTGEVASSAVGAHVTVTFDSSKPGLWINPGKTHAGAVELIDIGIPRGAPRAARVGLIGSAVIALVPRRGADSTKFSSGHVLVAGGSLGLSGAPAMASRGAMRAGAGYVTACLPAAIQPVLAAGATPELMTLALADSDGAFEPAAVEQVLAASGRGGSLVLGPGIGRSEQAQEFARALARRSQLALLLDADGLGAHAGRLGELAARDAPTVLTPHAGELARLLALDSSEIGAHRLEHVRAAARQAQAVVVLKGDDSLIADPDGWVAVSRAGTPALATAGTGDVLSGVIGALLAKGMRPFEAAAAGVVLHGHAGQLAAERLGGPEGVTAGDVIEALAPARARLDADMGEGQPDG